MMLARFAVTAVALAAVLQPFSISAQSAAARSPVRDSARIEALKRELLTDIDGRRKLTQEIVDMLFSFGELGFQEVESSRYLVGLLRRNGFTVRENVAGIPTAWVATWGSGKPVISLGSDVDGIPRASQKPGVAYHDPLVEGAPGHGEGHNSGQAVIITAALALKKVMEREKLSGTIQIWPGVAEELVAAKAWFVRDGLMKDVDVAIFTHVGSNLGVSYGPADGTGLISAEFAFAGQAAHSAGAPWRGRSALDAVELMNIAWNFRREHLRLQHRSHYVVTYGGDQPNVVPTGARVWYYFREIEAPQIRELFELGEKMAGAAATMTDTKLVSTRILGAAWPRFFNKPVAEAMHANIQRVGLPAWSEDDQTLARAIQKEMGAEKPAGLDTALSKIDSGTPPSQNRGGGSDDIGDISWVVPTITLRFPSNVPGLPGHHWSNAVAMATPIAHKGATAGAKAVALTMLDLFTNPRLVTDAWGYFRDVQTKETRYAPFIRPQDTPPTHLNAEQMAQYRPQLRRFYYDPTKYGTYLEQLGIKYPTVK